METVIFKHKITAYFHSGYNVSTNVSDKGKDRIVEYFNRDGAVKERFVVSSECSVINLTEAVYIIWEEIEPYQKDRNND